MIISYELHQSDYVDYNYFYVKKKAERSRISLVIIFLALCYLLLDIYLHGGETLLDFFTAPILFLAGYILLVLFVWSKWNVRNKVNKLFRSGRNAGLIGPRTLTFTEENLLITTSLSESKLKWPAFEYLKESDEHLFLFLTVNQAYIIPKRIFLLDQELHDVKSFIERKLSEQTR